MTGILLSKGTAALCRDELAVAARKAGFDYRVLHLPDDPHARLAPEDCAQVEIAYYTRDIRFSPFNDSFIDALAAASCLKWVHFVTAAIEHFPFVTALLERGVKLTRQCQTALQEAEQKVEILLKRTEAAEPVPFEPAEDSEI